MPLFSVGPLACHALCCGGLGLRVFLVSSLVLVRVIGRCGALLHVHVNFRFLWQRRTCVTTIIIPPLYICWDHPV